MHTGDGARAVSAALERASQLIRPLARLAAAQAVGVATAAQGLERMEPVVRDLLVRLSLADDVPRADVGSAPTDLVAQPSASPAMNDSVPLTP